MKKMVGILVLILLVTFTMPFYIPDDAPYLSSLKLFITAVVTILVPFILLVFIFTAWVTRHLHIRLERMNIGGINLLFHNPDIIYEKNLKSFLETKRTLYCIDKNLDNFNETFDSYFEIYQFVKKEMNILDTNKEKQKNLYNLSTKIISQLNLFLTSHQNNFRRWYNETVKENCVMTIEDGEIIQIDKKPHMMRIGELQKYYYDYDKLVEDFESINDFFCGEVNARIKVDIKKWERN